MRTWIALLVVLAVIAAALVFGLGLLDEGDQGETEPGEPPIGFLAMRRSAIVMVVPSDEELERPLATQPGTHERLHVRLHLQDVTIEGSVEALASLRISDFLEPNGGFLALSECTLEEGASVKRFAQLLVNAAHVLAVAEVKVGDRKELVGV